MAASVLGLFNVPSVFRELLLRKNLSGVGKYLFRVAIKGTETMSSLEIHGGCLVALLLALK